MLSKLVTFVSFATVSLQFLSADALQTFNNRRLFGTNPQLPSMVSVSKQKVAISHTAFLDSSQPLTVTFGSNNGSIGTANKEWIVKPVAQHFGKYHLIQEPRGVSQSSIDDINVCLSNTLITAVPIFGDPWTLCATFDAHLASFLLPKCPLCTGNDELTVSSRQSQIEMTPLSVELEVPLNQRWTLKDGRLNGMATEGRQLGMRAFEMVLKQRPPNEIARVDTVNVAFLNNFRAKQHEIRTSYYSQQWTMRPTVGRQWLQMIAARFYLVKVDVGDGSLKCVSHKQESIILADEKDIDTYDCGIFQLKIGRADSKYQWLVTSLRHTDGLLRATSPSFVEVGQKQISVAANSDELTVRLQSNTEEQQTVKLFLESVFI